MKLEDKQFLESMLAERSFDEFTRGKVVDYIESHDTLYGDIIPTAEVIQRIAKNLSKNIEFRDEFSLARGGASLLGKNIVVYAKDFGDDEFFHEMDHLGTSDLSQAFDTNSEDAWTNEWLERREAQGETIYSGIEQSGTRPGGGDYLYRKGENEGIEVIKQHAYAKLKGIQVKENGYDFNFKEMSQIAAIIGEEKLIKAHFYNDSQLIHDELAKYGVDFEQVCNLSKSINNVNMRDIEFWQQQSEESPKQEKLEELQGILNEGYVRKRCAELGIDFDKTYYDSLDEETRKLEIERIERFEEFSLCKEVSVMSKAEISEPSDIGLGAKLKNKFISLKNKFRSIFGKSHQALDEPKTQPRNESLQQDTNNFIVGLQNQCLTKEEIAQNDVVHKTFEQPVRATTIAQEPRINNSDSTL